MYQKLGQENLVPNLLSHVWSLTWKNAKLWTPQGEL